MAFLDTGLQEPLLIYSPSRTSEQTNSRIPPPQNQHTMMVLDFPLIHVNYETQRVEHNGVSVTDPDLVMSNARIPQ